LGVEAGSVVGIMAGRMPEWFVIDLAVQALGAITCGIQPTTSVEEVAHIVNDAGCRVFVAEDQEYVDKLLDVPANEEVVSRIVVVDQRGMFGYDDPRIETLPSLEERGRATIEREGGWFERVVSERSSDEVIG